MKFERTVEQLFDVICDGINPSVGSFNFSLVDVPNSSEFTALFDQYRLDSIDIEWFPEYTVLSDSGLTSNAINVMFNTAVDPVGYTPALYTDVLQYKTLKSTGITSRHKRTFKPMYLVDGIAPVNTFISTASPSSNWWGIVYGVPPTGVAMTFRSRVTFYMSMLISR